MNIKINNFLFDEIIEEKKIKFFIISNKEDLLVVYYFDKVYICVNCFMKIYNIFNGLYYCCC